MSPSKFDLPKIVLDPAVWGPHYWFFLHSVAYGYPEFPTSVTKRKYYDLIQNMPLFIPDERMGDKLAEFLDKYPVSPYLDSRESFIRWVYFLHNKFNVYLGKEEISIYKALDDFYYQYRPKPVIHFDTRMMYRDMVYIGCVLALMLFIYITAT
jgi:hypothetical protein